jgi:hypothetical protein
MCDQLIWIPTLGVSWPLLIRSETEAGAYISDIKRDQMRVISPAVENAERAVHKDREPRIMKLWISIKDLRHNSFEKTGVTQPNIPVQE